MKVITCDLCKKDVAYNVGIYGSPVYQTYDFDGGFIMKPARTDADLCHECYRKIAEAQNNVIEEIKAHQI